MEQEPNPEQYKQMAIECDYCGQDVWLDETTVALQVYLDPDVYMYSFAIIKCDNNFDCEDNYKFISPEDIVALSYLTNTVLSQRPSREVLDTLIEQHAKVYGLTLGEQSVQETVEVIEVDTWDARTLKEIQYADPFEYANDHEQRRWASTYGV